MVLLYSVVYFLLFGFSDWLYYRFKIEANDTRKMVHVCTGLIALSFPLFLEHQWQVVWLCLSFLLLMALSEKNKWFKSITSVDRKSYGSWLFALVVLACFYFQSSAQRSELYYLPILVLSICDPIAAAVGNSLSYKPLKVFGHLKTVGGSLAFLGSALLLLSIVNYYFYSLDWWSIVGIAAAATVAELLSTKGFDNLTIPGVIVLILSII